MSVDSGPEPSSDGFYEGPGRRDFTPRLFSVFVFSQQSLADSDTTRSYLTLTRPRDTPVGPLSGRMTLGDVQWKPPRASGVHHLPSVLLGRPEDK